jgi:hypothetical protein
MADDDRPVPMQDTTGTIPIWQSIRFPAYPLFPPPAPPHQAELCFPVPPRWLSTTVPCRCKTLRALSLFIYLPTYLPTSRGRCVGMSAALHVVYCRRLSVGSLYLSRVWLMPGRALWVAMTNCAYHHAVGRRRTFLLHSPYHDVTNGSPYRSCPR